MIQYTIEGKGYIHIQPFSKSIDLAQQFIRKLIEQGNCVRRMHAIRDNSRYMIPTKELVGFPFVNQGRQVNGRDIYHYVPFDRNNKEVTDIDDAIRRTNVEDPRANEIEWRRCFCEECTYKPEHCERRRQADDDA